MAHEPSSEIRHPALERSYRITANDGVVLEARLAEPASPRAVVVIAHPHPRHGGDLDNPVVSTVAAACSSAGLATLRFNFRGVGASSGTRGDGPAERADLAAALRAAVDEVPDVPLVACGYSFGAEVALTCDHPDLVAWLAVAPLLRLFDEHAYVPRSGSRAAHLVVAEHDEIAPPDAVAKATASWPRARMYLLAGTDHFLHGAHPHLAERVREVIATVLDGS